VSKDKKKSNEKKKTIHMGLKTTWMTSKEV
jgi:hypothetical protein